MAGYETNQPIIIKRIKKAAHVHHGGAWKIAYADFVTAMMAFFLLLWLISMTTPEQKQGLADYFAPPNVSPSNSGSGGVLGGKAFEDSGGGMAGSSVDASQDLANVPDGPEAGNQDNSTGGRNGQVGTDAKAVGASQTDLASKQEQVFHSAAASIRQAWQSLPNITELSDNLIVEETKEGLNIQVVDDDGRPLFPEGSKYPTEAARQAIAAIAPILEKLPNQISISGHTAAGGSYENPRYGAWELSSDRANVMRALLGEFGLSDDRIFAVVGRASTEPFFPNNPYMAANERIQITVLYDAPPVPPDMTP